MILNNVYARLFLKYSFSCALTDCSLMRSYLCVACGELKARNLLDIELEKERLKAAELQKELLRNVSLLLRHT